MKVNINYRCPYCSFKEDADVYDLYGDKVISCWNCDKDYVVSWSTPPAQTIIRKIVEEEEVRNDK